MGGADRSEERVTWPGAVGKWEQKYDESNHQLKIHELPATNIAFLTSFPDGRMSAGRLGGQFDLNFCHVLHQAA
jgi:hypothetical protein